MSSLYDGYVEHLAGHERDDALKVIHELDYQHANLREAESEVSMLLDRLEEEYGISLHEDYA